MSPFSFCFRLACLTSREKYEETQEETGANIPLSLLHFTSPAQLLPAPLFIMSNMVPDPPNELPPSIPEIQAQIDQLEAAHKAKKFPLSGRIIHLCHHLPVEITRVLPSETTGGDGNDSAALATGGASVEADHDDHAAGSIPHPSVAALQQSGAAGTGGVLSPPRTPEFKESDATQYTSEDGRWKLVGRRGHTAMISGIRSLSSTHEQVIVAWTGDIMQEEAKDDSASSTSMSTSTSSSSSTSVPTPHPNRPSPLRTQSNAALSQSMSPQPSTHATAPGVDTPGSTFPQLGGKPTLSAGKPTPPALSRQGSMVNVPSAAGMGSSMPVDSEKSVYLPELTDDEEKDLSGQLNKFSDHQAKKETGAGKMNYVPVFVPAEVARGHYEGYCKTTLWPLFHYLLWQDTPTDLNSPDPSWEQYVETNRLFAQRVAEIYKPGDLIIVHDYHLLLAPELIRQALKGRGDIREIEEVSIGMFVHTPWPSSEIFRCLPRRKEILDGMLGANHICFQTYSYSRHFKSTCIRVSAFESTPSGINAHGRVTSVGYCPIGVDVDRVIMDRDRPGVSPKIEALRSLYRGKKLIVSREKMDVAKGVYNKFQAFEKFLATYPEWRGKVVLIQVTTPALTETPDLDRQVAELVSRVNGTYGTLDFAPIHHYNQAIDRDEYFALLSAANMALITSLRDGMNTTSMEFVLCQDKTQKSPLVLSEFMGTSAAFTSALLINPHDLLGVAKAIDQGLRMSVNEKAQRHEELYKSVKSHTSHTWARTLLKQLLENVGLDHQAHQTPALDREVMKAAYKKAGKRLLLFDYDGTLTPIVKIPSDATPTPKTKNAISKLAQDPNNVVYIVSGRDAEFLQEWWGDVPNLGMSAEHGSFVRAPEEEEWTNMTDMLDMDWMPEVEEIFQYYTERTTGSTIEVKKASITWHYRQADPDFAEFQARQCFDLLSSNVATRRPVDILLGKANVEVRASSVNKGFIAERLIYENPDITFLFSAGDDKTDEDMFAASKAIGSKAHATVPGQPNLMAPPTGVTSLLTEEEAEELQSVELAIRPEGIFATAVGPPTKLTKADYHVTTPETLVEAIEYLTQ